MDIYSIDFARKHAAACAYGMNFGRKKKFRTASISDLQALRDSLPPGPADGVGPQVQPDPIVVNPSGSAPQPDPIVVESPDPAPQQDPGQAAVLPPAEDLGPKVSSRVPAGRGGGYLGWTGAGAGFGAGLGALLAARNGVNGTRGRRAAWGALGGAGFGALTGAGAKFIYDRLRKS